MSEPICVQCKGRGYVTRPCPACGLLRLRQGGLARNEPLFGTGAGYVPKVKRRASR